MTDAVKPYRLTTIACFVGIFVQSIIVNLVAVLFVPLMGIYGLDYVDLGIMVGVNFVTQISADILFSGLIDKIGFRKILLPASMLSFTGLLLFGLTPWLFPGREFIGFLGSTVIFAFSGGILEVILSPLFNTIPHPEKGPAMSLMHSCYAWGQALTVILTTVALFVFGSHSWQWIVFGWTLVPLATFTLFAVAKMPPNSAESARAQAKTMLLDPFFILALLAILFGGATEVSMNQWASTFLNGALAVPKLTGDILGMCGFAVMLGLGRLLYGVYGAGINLSRLLLWGSAFSALSYLIAAFSPWNGLNIVACAVTGLFCAVLWPGIIVVSSERFPKAGAWMFAILATAGDIGCSIGPYITGVITDYTTNWGVVQRMTAWYQTTSSGASMRLGLAFSVVFPLITCLCHGLIIRMKRQSTMKEGGIPVTTVRTMKCCGR